MKKSDNMVILRRFIMAAAASEHRGQIVATLHADFFSLLLDGSYLGVKSSECGPTGVWPRCSFSQLFLKKGRFKTIDLLKKSEISET